MSHSSKITIGKSSSERVINIVFRVISVQGNMFLKLNNKIGGYCSTKRLGETIPLFAWLCQLREPQEANSNSNSTSVWAAGRGRDTTQVTLHHCHHPFV